MDNRFYHSLWCIFLIFFTTEVALSDSPHPDLLKKIKRGEIERPYFMQHYQELIAKGINSPKGITPPMMPNENFNILVLLVDFSDNLAQTSDTFFDTLVFEPQTGTVMDYFEEVTYGNWTIVTIDPPGQTGWYRASRSYAYYVDEQGGGGDYPQNSQGLIEDLVEIVDHEIDFSVYDNDNDGNVEGLIVVHAGTGGEISGSDNDMWSHQWETNEPIIVDNVNVSAYSVVPEFWNNPGDMTCGVYAHEMGHAVFDLPDLYDTDEVSVSQGLGKWSLMAAGSWNGTNGDSPAHPDAWCKIKMGVVTPFFVTTNLTEEIITPSVTYATVYRLWINGTVGDEYFLVENRQQIGYDSELPGEGLLIYHVSDTVSTDNDNQWYPGHTNDGHYLVALEQADMQWHLEHNTNQGDTGDPYPGSTNNTAFADSTMPDSRGYSFGSSAIAVTNISPPGTYMTADLTVETDYIEHVVSIDFLETMAIHVIDIDEDGDEDIVGASEDADSELVWWENDGNGNFTAHSIYDYFSGVIDVFVTDIDGDNDLDLLSARNGNDAIIWWENNGSESFTEHLINDDMWRPQAVYAADMDNDFDIDVLGASDAYDDSHISWWKNNGGEIFTEDTIATQEFGFLDVLAYDIDRDDDMDILGSGYNLIWLENEGNGNFTEHIIDEYYWAYSIDVSNVDNDGDFDILAALEDYDKIVWWENDGNQNFTEHIISDSFDGANHVYAIDIDNDYDVDVLGAARISDRISLWINDGNQNFTEQVITEDFIEASSVSAADIDGDGDIDIIGGAENGSYTGPNISWWEQVGDPSVFIETPDIVGILKQFSINSPYPNPFNPSTNIRYTLPKPEKVKIEVYNMFGQKIETLLNKPMPAGSHELVFTAKNLPSGLYFCRLSAGKFNQIKKMILLK